MKTLGQLRGAIALTGLIAATTAIAADLPITVTLAPALAERLDTSLGIEEGPVLQRIVTEAVARAVTPDRCRDTARIDITLAEAEPTHPTRRQLIDQPGLDFLRSKSIGGAALSAKIFNADGKVIDTVSYRRYPPTIQWASEAAETWSDARLAIDNFATKLAADCGRLAPSAPTRQ
jgi:hypothetical protein